MVPRSSLYADFTVFRYTLTVAMVPYIYLYRNHTTDGALVSEIAEDTLFNILHF